MSHCGKHMKKRGRKSKKGKKHTIKGGMLRVIAKGGSLASDMVMANVNGKATPGQYPPGKKITTVHPYGNTCLYQTTGGGEEKNNNNNGNDSKNPEGKEVITNTFKTIAYGTGNKNNTITNPKNNKNNKNNKNGGGKKKSKKVKKTKKSKKAKKSKKTKKGRKQHGGGSDWISSQYSLDVGQNKDVNPAIFSKSKPASMNKLLNPPNLGSAGSGYANVAMGASVAGAPL